MEHGCVCGGAAFVKTLDIYIALLLNLPYITAAGATEKGSAFAGLFFARDFFCCDHI